MIFLKLYQRNMSKKRYKGFASIDEAIFNQNDFLAYFEDRVSEIVRNEVEAHFRDMFWKY